MQLQGAACFLLFLSGCGYGADIQMWVDDSSGTIGKVDVTTGAVSLVGHSGVILTDIAFAANGDLYGISYSDLYRINSSTGLATLVGPLAGATGSPNALVFGTNGTLYMASSNLYSVNISTGASTDLGSIGYTSAGDLAFVNGTLYLSSNSNQLIAVNPSTGAGTAVGALGVSGVLGLASPGNGSLYGVAGTSLYLIDTSTGAATFDVGFGGQGLGAAYGESFISEALTTTTPEPKSGVLLSTGLLCLALGLRHVRRFRFPT